MSPLPASLTLPLSTPRPHVFAGALSYGAVETLCEVAKQAKYLVAAELRGSVEEYVALLGRLQLNGFELTADEEMPQHASSKGGKAADDGHGQWAQGRSIGLGIYPSAAMFNHSCNPNARVSFDSHGCVSVHATRDVKKGEEFTITYVDTRLAGAERRQKLLKTYAFHCSCTRCERELC